jgi:hypothetical protein
MDAGVERATRHPLVPPAYGPGKLRGGPRATLVPSQRRGAVHRVLGRAADRSRASCATRRRTPAPRTPAHAAAARLLPSWRIRRATTSSSSLRSPQTSRRAAPNPPSPSVRQPRTPSAGHLHGRRCLASSFQPLPPDPS